MNESELYNYYYKNYSVKEAGVFSQLSRLGMRSGGLRGMGMWMRANLGGNAGKRAVINQMREMAVHSSGTRAKNPLYQRLSQAAQKRGIGSLAGQADRYMSPAERGGMNQFNQAIRQAHTQAGDAALKRYEQLTNQAYNYSGAPMAQGRWANGSLAKFSDGTPALFKTGLKDAALAKQANNFNFRVNGGANYKVPTSFSTPAVNPNQFKDAGGLKLMGAGIAGSMGANYLFGNNNQNTANTQSTQYNY